MAGIASFHCQGNEFNNPWLRNQDASLVVQMVKNLPAIQETWVRPLRWEDPLEESMATHSSILSCLENSHGQRSLAGYSPLGCKESEMTERLNIQGTNIRQAS